MQLTERVGTGRGFNWSLFGILYVWGGGEVVLYEFDEDTEKEFGGESRGSDVLDGA